ncbi:MAG TPA: hypothetical protein VMY76_11025 [Gemmatimonadales bacterium]|nr:hypothetical protein [Gemmatimonadales bacterium]
MRRRPAVRWSPFALLFLSAACTGLSAGPEVSASMPVPVSRDSAWVRAKRALQAEVFSISGEDSLQGRISAMRYPSTSAKVGTAAACRVQMSLTIGGAPESAELVSTTRWIAPTGMAAHPDVCEEDRQETLDRIALTIAPPAP